jgi:hypothetical protein
LWLEEIGVDLFIELSRVVPGLNSGWVQIRGPVSRIAEYKAIETSAATDPCIGSVFRIAANPLAADEPRGHARQALARLFMLPGAVYKAPN